MQEKTGIVLLFTFKAKHGSAGRVITFQNTDQTPLLAKEYMNKTERLKTERRGLFPFTAQPGYKINQLITLWVTRHGLKPLNNAALPVHNFVLLL